MRTTSSYQTDFGKLSLNNSPANQAWGLEQVNISSRYLTKKYYFNETSYVTTSVAQQQAYILPFDVKDVINVTVLVGGVLWQPVEAPNRQFWDSLNTIPFYSDFPQFWYRYNGQMLLFPYPASNGNTITMNYKRRTQDLSVADYTTGTIVVNNASANVVGTTTAWTANMQGRWLNIPYTTSNTTSGDNNWYQIASVTDATHLVLNNLYTGPNASGAAYTIGEALILPEDYQDLPLYRALRMYYTSVVPNPNQSKLYKELYDEGFIELDEEFGSKSTSPVLTPPDAPVFNPNLFPRA